MDRPGVRQVPDVSGEQGKVEKTGCKVICGAPTTLAVKGLIMMMMSVSHMLSQRKSGPWEGGVIFTLRIMKSHSEY